jgi:hypothetical protein
MPFLFSESAIEKRPLILVSCGVTVLNYMVPILAIIFAIIDFKLEFVKEKESTETARKES